MAPGPVVNQRVYTTKSLEIYFEIRGRNYNHGQRKKRNKPSEGTSRAEESGGEKKDEKENQLKRTKSRELRGGIMYYSCHCIKRNGLQHDCRRTGCGGEPACLHMPDPLCAPSQLARARGLADPGPLATHMHAKGGGGNSGSSETGGHSRKRFIVCELKGITPDISTDKPEKCCKCPTPISVATQGSSGGKVGACALASVPTITPTVAPSSNKKCPFKGQSTESNSQGMFVFDEKTINKILASFDKKDIATKDEDVVMGPGGRSRKVVKPVVKEPCTRPGCVHWQPPPPCCWDGPCKADCFETPPGIRPGRSMLSGDGGGNVASGGSMQGAASSHHQRHDNMRLLTPNYCTGCSAPGSGAVTATGSGGGPAPGLPVLVMKLC